LTTSPTTSPTAPSVRGPLRLRLNEAPAHGDPDGAWWPYSRSLHTEAADLVDHFPRADGRVNRLLFSRPDWDDSTAAGRGVRRILAARGPVKVGSFPSDDTALMIVTLASGRRLKLIVIPSDLNPADAEELLGSSGATSAAHTGGTDWARWDDESP
jgi:hypothetical protein